MEEETVKRLALVLAVQAEIEGMKTSNDQYLRNNHPQEYHQWHFDEKAEELRQLAYAHRDNL